MRVLPNTFGLMVAGVVIAAQLSAGTIEGKIQKSPPAKDLSNFVIWVEDFEGSFSAPEKPFVMDQKDMRFVPHVLVVPAGATVEFPNSDPVAHNVFSISKVKRFNLGLYQRGAVRRVTFNKPGVVELLCNVHLEMSAFIVVVETPYFAKTGAEGTFRIENVPAGTHRLYYWHEGGEGQSEEVEVPVEGTVTVTMRTDLK